MLHETFDQILKAVADACRDHYGRRLVSLVVFGSVARGTMRHDSDIDLLVVVDDLPRGRIPRVRDFDLVEAAVEEQLKQAESLGIYTRLSPVIKTPTEVRYGSPLFLDMTLHTRMLADRDEFLSRYLDRLRARLQELGARRVRRGGGYYWILKPGYQPGEEIQL